MPADDLSELVFGLAACRARGDTAGWAALRYGARVDPDELLEAALDVIVGMAASAGLDECPVLDAGEILARWALDEAGTD